MPSPRFEAAIRRRSGALVRDLAGEIVRLREDAGLSQRAVAAEAGLDAGHLSRVESAAVRLSLETYLRIAAVLGADLSSHLYPTTGPTIHDRHQAPVAEALLDVLHPRWQPFTEVGVRRPARGWIELVLHDPTPSWRSRRRSSPPCAGSSSSFGGRPRRPSRSHRGSAGTASRGPRRPSPSC